MAKISAKLFRLFPKRWRKKVTYIIYFLLLVFIEVLELIERLTKRLVILVKQQRAIATAIFMVLLVVIAVLVSVTLHKSDAEPEVITYSTDSPAETKPDEMYEWRGLPEDPKKITIPNAQTDGYIQKVGKDQNNQIAVPNNIHIAGWFVYSARPGQPGLSIIDGHVDGRLESGGVFKHIDRLNEGDAFKVELGNGTILEYRVHSVSLVDTDRAVSKLFSQTPGIVSQLNLITCGGNYDRESRDYDKRIIVEAELVVSQ